MKTYCDPPSGWQYGFPKVIPDEVTKGEKDFNQWLVDEGYPQELIDKRGEKFYCRYWQKET